MKKMEAAMLEMLGEEKGKIRKMKKKQKKFKDVLTL